MMTTFLYFILSRSDFKELRNTQFFVRLNFFYRIGSRSKSFDGYEVAKKQRMCKTLTYAHVLRTLGTFTEKIFAKL